MIIHFRDKGLQLFFEDDDRSQLSADNIARIQEILTLLDSATRPGDLDQPGYRLHPLHGRFSGFWSVRVNRNWRIIFRFDGTNVTDVDLTDYHRG